VSPGLSNSELATLLCLIRARVEDGSATDTAYVVDDLLEGGQWTADAQITVETLRDVNFYGLALDTPARLRAIDRALAVLEGA
jgi:hypothetical protein